MWTNISLTATEKPLFETYLPVWNTCRGNKIDIHNEELEVGQANLGARVSLRSYKCLCMSVYEWVTVSVGVCVLVCVKVCVCVCVCEWENAWVIVRVCACDLVCVRVRLFFGSVFCWGFVCICVYEYLCVCVGGRVCECVWVCVWVSVYECLRV